MNIKKIFPRSTIGANVNGACNVYDVNNDIIGWHDIDQDRFYLRQDYKHADKAYKALMSYDADIDIAEIIYGQPKQNEG